MVHKVAFLVRMIRLGYRESVEMSLLTCVTIVPAAAGRSVMFALLRPGLVGFDEGCEI